jgi:hypothetical protein
MAKPHKSIVAPAIECENLCKGFNFTRLIPLLATRTKTIIVEMRVKPKQAVTIHIPVKLCFAAGYITIGINGSQGPKTNMANSTQGVVFIFPLSR